MSNLLRYSSYGGLHNLLYPALPLLGFRVTCEFTLGNQVLARVGEETTLQYGIACALYEAQRNRPFASVNDYGFGNIGCDFGVSMAGVILYDTVQCSEGSYQGFCFVSCGTEATSDSLNHFLNDAFNFTTARNDVAISQFLGKSPRQYVSNFFRRSTIHPGASIGLPPPRTKCTFEAI